jgi:RNA polymerase sigma-70 factor (ECF subfamily)
VVRPEAAVALERQFRELEPVLFRFALRATHDREAARDLTQDTLLAALADAATFEGRSGLRTWLVGILSHKIIDHFRRGKVRVADGSDAADLLATPSASDVERVVAARRELAAVDRALSRLPEHERLALLLVDVEELERAQVCRVLAVTPTHLRVLLHRGRHRLRRVLEDGV